MTRSRARSWRPTLVRRLPAVRECMDKRVPTVPPDMPILDAIASLLKNHVTGAPVVDEDGNMVGMLSEKDCLKLLTRGVEADVPDGTVASFMTTDITTISPDTDVYFAAGVFGKHDFRRLPVVEGGKLVGAITRFDLLRVIHANLR